MCFLWLRVLWFMIYVFCVIIHFVLGIFFLPIGAANKLYRLPEKYISSIQALGVQPLLIYQACCDYKV